MYYDYVLDWHPLVNNPFSEEEYNGLKLNST